MGLFDIFKKKKNDNTNVTSEQDKVAAVGESLENISNEIKAEVNNNEMDAIDIVFSTIYTDKKDYKINDSLINKISVYNNESYLYFVTHGLSQEHNIEFTFKLNKESITDIKKEIECVCSNFELVAKLVKEKNQIFDELQYVYTAKDVGIDASGESKITGFITISDAIFKNENIKFVEFVGATHNELSNVVSGKISVLDLYEKIGSDVTDYKRNSII